MATRTGWRDVRTKLTDLDEAALVMLIRNLYEASPENRRFLHARLLGGGRELDSYRQLVEDAVFPDPLSRKRVKIAEAKRLIQHYRRATGDEAGMADLLVSAVAAGTEQAADLGYGDEAYFAALLGMLATAVSSIQRLPTKDQLALAERLRAIARRAEHIGWGYGDAVQDIVAWPEPKQGRSEA